MAMSDIAHRLDDAERTEDVSLNVEMPFDKMMLRDPVHRGLQNAGFVYPTKIQALAIPAGKSGTDLLIQSKAGTGKTLIFTIAILEDYRDTIKGPQALIVVPTRELAVQINDVFKSVGRFMNDFRTLAVTGGVPCEIHRACVPRAKVVIGTPGRLVHLLDAGILNTSEINTLVWDEADKLYTKSFIDDVKRIRKALPANIQTIACSATFDDDLDKELAKSMRNPLYISAAVPSMTLLGIKQFVYELPEEKTSILEMRGKLKALNDIFARVKFKQCLIFASTKMRADSYHNYLVKEGWSCEMISGSMEQADRLEKYWAFRQCKTRILIATDVMSRGIDSLHANLIINLELPNDIVTYLHRVGRAGRFGSHGVAISFIASQADTDRWQSLTSLVHHNFVVLKFPQADADTGRDLWDFSNFSEDVKCYGLYDAPKVSNKISPNQIATTQMEQDETNEPSDENDKDSKIAEEDRSAVSGGHLNGSLSDVQALNEGLQAKLMRAKSQMEVLRAALEMVDGRPPNRTIGIGEASEGNANSSIDTGTFQIDSRESAINIPEICYDISERELLPQPLPQLAPLAPKSSSNTIDDASSIDVDSCSYDCEGTALGRNGPTLEDREVAAFTCMPDAFDQYELHAAVMQVPDRNSVVNTIITSSDSHSKATSVTVTAEMEGTGRDTSPEKADDEAPETNELSVGLTHPIVSPLDSEYPPEETVHYTLHYTSRAPTPAYVLPEGEGLSVEEPRPQVLSLSNVEHLDIAPDYTLRWPRNFVDPEVYIGDESAPEFAVTPVSSGSVLASSSNIEILFSTSDMSDLGRPTVEGSGDGSRIRTLPHAVVEVSEDVESEVEEDHIDDDDDDDDDEDDSLSDDDDADESLEHENDDEDKEVDETQKDDDEVEKNGHEKNENIRADEKPECSCNARRAARRAARSPSPPRSSHYRNRQAGYGEKPRPTSSFDSSDSSDADAPPPVVRENRVRGTAQQKALKSYWQQAYVNQVSHLQDYVRYTSFVRDRAVGRDKPEDSTTDDDGDY